MSESLPPLDRGAEGSCQESYLARRITTPVDMGRGATGKAGESLLALLLLGRELLGGLAVERVGTAVAVWNGK